MAPISHNDSFTPVINKLGMFYFSSIFGDALIFFFLRKSLDSVNGASPIKLMTLPDPLAVGTRETMSLEFLLP